MPSISKLFGHGLNRKWSLRTKLSSLFRHKKNSRSNLIVSSDKSRPLRSLSGDRHSVHDYPSKAPAGSSSDVIAIGRETIITVEKEPRPVDPYRVQMERIGCQDLVRK